MFASDTKTGEHSFSRVGSAQAKTLCDNDKARAELQGAYLMSFASSLSRPDYKARADRPLPQPDCAQQDLCTTQAS